MRRPLDQRWSMEIVKAIKGSPKEPSPGSNHSKIPVFVKYSDPAELKVDRRFAHHVDAKPEPRQLYIYKKDVDEHGPTEGCRACASLGKNGHARGYTHTQRNAG